MSSTRIDDDLSRPVIVHAARQPWIPSPAAGVDRRMLFRIGDEVARATSIVRDAEGSAFPRHTPSGGEEILVLDGAFEDEHGGYPAGSSFRDPPGTSHVPASRGGCATPTERAKLQGTDDFIAFGTVACASFFARSLLYTSGWSTINTLALPAVASVLAPLVWQAARRGRMAAPRVA